MSLVEKYHDLILKNYHIHSFGIAIFKRYNESWRFIYIGEKDALWGVAIESVGLKPVGHSIYVAIENIDGTFNIEQYFENIISSFEDRRILLCKKTF